MPSAPWYDQYDVDVYMICMWNFFMCAYICGCCMLDALGAMQISKQYDIFISKNWTIVIWFDWLNSPRTLNLAYKLHLKHFTLDALGAVIWSIRCGYDMPGNFLNQSLNQSIRMYLEMATPCRPVSFILFMLYLCMYYDLHLYYDLFCIETTHIVGLWFV